MRSVRRTVTLCVICLFVLIYLLAVLLQPSEVFDTDAGRNYSWWMDYKVLHEPTVFHEQSSVLIVVTSAPQNMQKRHAIRETWGSWPRFRVLYLLGVPANYSDEQQRRIESEVLEFGDVIQMDFVDNYRNLTLKSCSLVMWAVRNPWPKRQLVIKVDDDTCVDMPLLTHVLDDFKDGLYGDYRRKSTPLRCKRPACDKWGLTLDEYPASTFPPHLQGAFYVIVESSLMKLHDHLFIPQFLFIEDVYLTGLVTESANVTVHPMPKETRVNPMAVSKNWESQINLLAQHQCHEGLQYRFYKHSLRRAT